MADSEKSLQGAAEVVGAPAKSAGSSKSPLLMMVVVLVGVPLICYLMVDFLVMPKLVAAINKAGGGASHGAAGAKHEGGASKEETVDFGKIMVNVASSGANSYLRINLVFAGTNPGLKETIKQNEVALRDAAITVLSAQTLADLEKSDGRETTRRALLSRINGVLGGPVVSQIYFTEFVIQ